VLWRGLAEVAEKYVTKGRQLYIEGRIRTRNYDDKDGNKRYITEIYGDTMQMLGTRGDDKSGTGQYTPNQNNTESVLPSSTANEPEMDDVGGDEDLPF
jgi:single-strand DNA-binding protein